MDIKAYQDGDDFVLVFKNCSADIKKMLETLLQPSLFAEASAEKGETPETVVGYGPYKSLTATEVLTKYGDAGYANLMYLISAKLLSKEAEEQARDSANLYLVDRFSSIDESYAENAEEKEIRSFAGHFAMYLSDTQKKSVTQQAGFEKFSDFIENAGILQIRSFASCMIDKIKKDMH